IGFSALSYGTPGSYNTAIGSGADVNGTYVNATADGSGAIVNATDKVRLGSALWLTNVVGAPGAGSTWTYDKRFKTNVEDGVVGLDFILKLRPVVYNMDTRKLQEFLTEGMDETKKEKYLKGDCTKAMAERHTGFIAQEVEKTMEEVGYDFSSLN